MRQAAGPRVRALAQARLVRVAVGVVGAAAALAGVALADERARILAPTTDFSQAERWETLQGGTATNRKRLDREAFSQPSSSLDFERRADFFVGNGLFKRLWVSSPSSTRAADGLGPLYNARACQRCHLKDGRGHPPADAEDSAVSMLLRLSVPARTEAERGRLAAHRVNAIPEPTYGGQLQDVAVPGLRGEGAIRIDYESTKVRLADGQTVALRAPRYRIDALAYGPLDPETRVSPRIAPPMIGLGLLEAIAEADVVAAADPDDADGDGISGRPNRVWSATHGQVMLGRFGWKAGQPTIDDQAGGAMSGDIGVSNPVAPAHAADCTAAQADCLDAPHGAGEGELEASPEVMALIAFYSRHLAVPARRAVDDPEVLAGKRLFYEVGCTGCHTPKHATRSDWPDDALAGQLIWPYTDLLLHDMGEGLADHSPEGEASGREWRTPPLWGIGLTETVNGHTFFLHDGRARNLTEAILWHGGEAARARAAFASLAEPDRRRLLTFLESL